MEREEKNKFIIEGEIRYTISLMEVRHARGFYGAARQVIGINGKRIPPKARLLYYFLRRYRLVGHTKALSIVAGWMNGKDSRGYKNTAKYIELVRKGISFAPGRQLDWERHCRDSRQSKKVEMIRGSAERHHRKRRVKTEGSHIASGVQVYFRR